MEKDITVLPIFNQAAPGVWSDFAYICSATVRDTYNASQSVADITADIATDERQWRQSGMKFAFGAYDGANMVGFIQGRSAGRCTTIQSLYVLHEYQNLHLGTRLLYSAESAIAPITRNVELIALPGAMSFYERHGYKSPMHTNEYIKQLKIGGFAGTVPVFKCNAAIARECDKIARKTGATFDAAAINAAHTPMFVFQNAVGKILGYAVGNDDYNVTELVTGNGFESVWMQKRLYDAFARLAEHHTR